MTLEEQLLADIKETIAKAKPRGFEKAPLGKQSIDFAESLTNTIQSYVENKVEAILQSHNLI